MGLVRDSRGQGGVSDPRGQGVFPFSFVRGEAMAIGAEAVSLFSWVWSVTREGREVFRIREGRACFHFPLCVVRLWPSGSRL